MRLLLLVCSLLAVAPVARAQDAVADVLEVEARERISSERMALGLLTGRISSAEEERLERLVERLHAFQATAYADGVISRRERARLDRMQRRLDRSIEEALAR